jgi:hypothetical protein
VPKDRGRRTSGARFEASAQPEKRQDCDDDHDQTDDVDDVVHEVTSVGWNDMIAFKKAINPSGTSNPLT